MHQPEGPRSPPAKTIPRLRHRERRYRPLGIMYTPGNVSRCGRVQAAIRSAWWSCSPLHSAGTRPPSRSCVSTLEDLQDGPKCRNDSCIGHPSAILPEWEAAACSQSAAELLPGSFRAPCATGKLAREARRSRRRLHLAFACAGAVEKRSSANTRHKIPARDRCSAPAPGDRTPRQTFCSQPSGPASSSSLRHICRRPNGMAMDSP